MEYYQSSIDRGILDKAEQERMRQMVALGRINESLFGGAGKGVTGVYDGQLVWRLVEKIMVYDDRLWVELKSGSEIDVEK